MNTQKNSTTERFTIVNSFDPQHCKSSEDLISLCRFLEGSILKEGPWSLKVASAFCSLGNIYNRLGMFPEALAMHERDLQITRHGLAEDEPRVAGAKYNVGLASCKTGQFAQAEPLLADALRVRTAALGPQHPEVADVLTCIGGVYSCTGQHAKALDMYETATAIRMAAFGPFDVAVALSLRNSAAARGCLGKTDQVFFLPRLTRYFTPDGIPLV
jgi:tetratricopeptide (TPR) repeat protein